MPSENLPIDSPIRSTPLESGDHVSTLLARLLDGSDKIRTVFQPVVSLLNGRTYGYEAFTRGTPGSLLELPADLFLCAEKANCVAETDNLCLRSAIASAAPFLANPGPEAPQLFLNLHSRSVLVGDAAGGVFAVLSERVNAIGLAPERVVLEITERQAVEDLPQFARALTTLRHRGFGIAVDDAGAGYHSLEVMANLSPEHMKLDRSLIAGVDSKPGKRALISVIVDLALQIGTRLIAEGIETQAELSVLVDLGIEYGQGYLIARPTPGFAPITGEITNRIVRTQDRRRRTERSRSGPPIADLIVPATKQTLITADLPILEVQDRFADLSEDDGMPVVDTSTNRPIGLLMKRSLQARLAMPFGHELLARKTAAFVMDAEPLLVDETITLEGAVRRLLGRGNGKLDDHVIVTREGKYIGYISGRNLLTRMTDMQIRQARHANPLTGLPANVPIEQEVNARLEKGTPTALLYVDLDHFKPFNDRYGVARGDEAILTLARVLSEAVHAQQSDTDLFTDDFIGHLGGDDFFVLVPAEEGERISREIVSRFDAAVHALHAQEDIKRGFFVGHDRRGVLGEFPLLSTSVATLLVTGTDPAGNYVYATELLSDLKSEVKKIPGSSYLVRDLRPIATA